MWPGKMAMHSYTQEAAQLVLNFVVVVAVVVLTDQTNNFI